MRADGTPIREPGPMTPAEQRMALEARIQELEALVSAQLESSGAGLPGAPLGDGSSGNAGSSSDSGSSGSSAGSGNSGRSRLNPSTADQGSGEGAVATLDPAQVARLEELAEAIADVENRLDDLPLTSTPEGLDKIESSLVDLNSTVTDLKLDTLRIESDYSANFTEVSQQIQSLAETSGGVVEPQALKARTNGSLVGDEPNLKLWGLLLGIPSLIALLGGWLFSRTGRSRSATVVEHIERRIDDVDERQARIEERHRESLPLGKRGAYLAGAGAVAALSRSKDPVDREAADFFTDADAASKPVAQQEAEEFFGETAGPQATEAAPIVDDETSFTLVPEPAPEPVERFERTREAFRAETEGVPAPEDQWQTGAGEDTLEARLARGIQERYFAENEGKESPKLSSGAIDWDEATRAQADERARMGQLDNPISQPGSDSDRTPRPWGPLTSDPGRADAEEAGWRNLAQRRADEAARYADGALDDEDQGSDDEPDLV